jgi:hypothetical protein
MGELFKLIGFGTPFIYGGATYGLFYWLDKKSSDDAKSAISRLLEWEDYDPKRVSAAFVEIFDWLYSRPLLSKGAFVRSCVITLVITVVFMYESAWFGDLFEFFFKGWIDASLFWEVLSTTIVSLAVNVASDYASLFFIRAWLVQTLVRPVATLLIAALIGTFIIAITFALRFTIAGLVQMNAGSLSRNVLVTPADLSPHMLSEAYLPARLFYPGILGFGWLPLLAAGIVLLRAGKPLLIVVRKAQWFLKDGKDHPLDAIGCVAGAIVFALVVVWQWWFRAAAT